MQAPIVSGFGFALASALVVAAPAYAQVERISDPVDETTPRIDDAARAHTIGVEASMATRNAPPFGVIAVDARARATFEHDVSLELHQAAGLLAVPGDNNVPQTSPLWTDLSAAMHWSPLLVDDGSWRANLTGAYLAPIALATFGRTAGGLVAALGIEWNHVTAASDSTAALPFLRVRARAGVDGVVHPLHWSTIRVDGSDPQRVAALAPLLLVQENPCGAASMTSSFRHACTPASLARFGPTFDVEVRSISDALALSFAAAHSEAWLEQEPVAGSSLSLAGTTTLALRASWRPAAEVEVGGGSLWRQVPAVDSLPFALDEPLREATWFVDVTGRFDVVDEASGRRGRAPAPL